MADEQTTARLEYLRGKIRAECISYSELAELQSLADQIDPGDVELLEWAGVPEGQSCPICEATIGPSSSYPWHMPDEDCRAIRQPVTS